ncbi:MAG: extracellular solute-binding protein [Sphaerochaetaceae bacterium]|jgi:multiple sugar transport system substrate-binding protein|nr:extracellular solute-binding protein [Sphaerochaetaceae bacterium]NLV83428.1 extracellular solute-binding protein [Spirochaetales bacterium]
MKKVLLTFFVLCMLIVPLFAQGVKQAEEQITLQVWTHEDPNRTRIEEQYIKEFEAANPNIKIVRTTQASSKIIELIQTAFAANSGPDIFDLSIDNEYAYIVNGRVAPVNPQAAGFANQQELMAGYMDGILDPVTVDGKIYGLPLELTNWCIFINKKVFRSVGLDPEKDYPKTWEDMVALSEKLVIRDGDILIRRGFDFRYPYYLIAFIPMVEQLGGKLVSDDGKEAIVNEQAWLKFLRFMQEWGPSGKNLGSPTYKNARSLFNKDNNDIAMATTGMYQIGRIKAENPEFYDSGEWMVVPFPVFKDAVKDVASCYYGHYYMVNAQSSPAQQEAAWKYIGFVLSHSEDYLTECALIQPTKELMNSAAYKAVPYNEVFTKDFERGHIVYYEKNSAELQSLVRTAVESVMMSGVTPEKALATLKAAAQELIDEQ